MAVNRAAPRSHQTPRHGGFTLVEMMITITVAAVLLAIVVPSFVTFTQSQRVKTGSFDLYSALMLARSEAVKQRANVTVTAKNGDWSNGWAISGGTVLSQDPPKGLTITSDFPEVTYQLDGRLTSGSASYLELTATGSSTAGRRCLTIDPAGVPRSRVLTGPATCP